MIRNKHVKVIFFSSFPVIFVMLSVLIGSRLYFQWKDEVSAAKYQSFIYKVTAEMFRDKVVVFAAAVKPGRESRDAGIAGDMPVLDGKVKNNSGKTVISVMIEVVFLRPDGSVVYRDWFYPLEQGFSNHSPFFSSRKRSGTTIASGESMAFRHILDSCPSEVLEQIRTKGVFAKTEQEKAIRFELSVRGLSLL